MAYTCWLYARYAAWVPAVRPGQLEAAEAAPAQPLREVARIKIIMRMVVCLSFIRGQLLVWYRCKDQIIPFVEIKNSGL